MVDLKFTNAIGQIEAANVTPCGDCCVKYETDDGPGNLDNGTYTGPLGDQPCSDDAPEYAKIRDGILLTTGNCNGTFVADCGYIRTVRNYLGPTSSATRKTPKLFLLLALGFLTSSVAAFDVLGIVSGILGIVSFAQQSAPDPLPQPAMKVRLGLNGVNGGLKNAGGGLPMAKAFDYNGRQIAQNFHQTWPGLNRGSGEIFDIEFDESPQLQVQNWELHAQTDGICIAYISYQDSNGRDGAWLGDVGRLLRFGLVLA